MVLAWCVPRVRVANRCGGAQWIRTHFCVMLGALLGYCLVLLQKQSWFKSLSNRSQIAPNRNQRNCLCAGAWVCVKVG
eukprot:5394589-Lingulodinium_polyedra.AAC.1